MGAISGKPQRKIQARKAVAMSVRRSTRFLGVSVFVITFLAGVQVCAAQERETRAVQMVNVTTQLEKTIDAKKSKAGDPVTAKVTVGTTLNDGTNVPSGSILSGHIDSVVPAEKRGSDSNVVLTFDKLAVKNGKEIPVKAVVVQIASFADKFGQEQANNDPDANRGTHSTVGAPGAEVIAHPQDNSNAMGLHPVAGLTLSGSANDSSSATLTQAKKNLHLTNATQMVVSVAVLP